MTDAGITYQLLRDGVALWISGARLPVLLVWWFRRD